MTTKHVDLFDQCFDELIDRIYVLVLETDGMMHRRVITKPLAADEVWDEIRILHNKYGQVARMLSDPIYKADRMYVAECRDLSKPTRHKGVYFMVIG